MAEGALRELVAFLGFEVDDKKLKDADDRLNKTAESAKKLAEAVIVAFAIDKVAEFLKGQIEVGAQLSHTSEMLGISTGDLQAFQYAAETVGVGVDEANTALRFLNRTMGEAATGNAEASQEFTKLHVVLKDTSGHLRPVHDVLADVADGFQKMPDAATRTAAAMKIFGRSGSTLIPLLKKGSAGVNELYKEFEELGGGLSEDFIAQAEEGEHQLVKFKTTMKGLASVIAGPVIEALTPLIDDFTQIAKGMRDMATQTPIVHTALTTLLVVSAALAAIWIVMNIEIFLVIAALALFVLAIEDLYVWLNGGESVMGDFLDSIGGKGTSANVRDFLKSLKQDFEQILDKVETELVPAVMELWQSFQSEDGKKSVHDFKDALSAAAEVAHDLAGAVAQVAHWAAVAADALAKLDLMKKGGKVDQVGQAAGLPKGAAPEVARGVFGGLSDIYSVVKQAGDGTAIGRAIAAVANNSHAISASASIPGVTMGTGIGGGGDATYQVNVTNHINGAGDPSAVAGKTGDATSDALKRVQNAAYAGIRGGG